MNLRAESFFVQRASRDAEQGAHREQQSPRRQHIDRGLGHDDERGAGHAQRQPGPTPGIDALMRDGRRQQADQDGLQGCD
ncbi:hypothetical protein D3C72_2100630 [compost metagenome]